MPRNTQKVPWQLLRSRRSEQRGPLRDQDIVERRSRALTGRLPLQGNKQSCLNLQSRPLRIANATGVLNNLAREARKALSEREIGTGQWRHITRLLATIAAGAKPENITLSDGRRLHIYRSKTRRVDFLASGPKRSLGDFVQRMQEGEALALNVDMDMIRLSRSHQTTIKDHYSGSDRSRALRVRSWVNDLGNRLQSIREAVALTPSNTPLGGLANQWFQDDPKSRMPQRTKWISLATWSRKDAQYDSSPSLPCPPTNDELLLGSQPPSAHVPSLDDQPASIEQTNSAAQPILWTSPPPRLDDFLSSWTTRFERMCRGEGLNLYVLDQRSIGPLIQAYASTTKSVKWMHSAWEKTAHLSISPIEMWGDIMLWCLHNSSYRALRLLNTTICGGSLKPPRYVANDCLTYLAQHFLRRNKKPDRNVLHAFWDTIRMFLDSSSNTIEQAQTIDDSVIYLLLRHSNDERARTLLELCMTSNVSLHVNTLLHFLDRSIKWGTLSLSIRLLQRIVKSGFDPSSDQVQSACVKIIRTHITGDIGYRVQTKIVTQLLEMGIVPKIAMTNAILLNAGEAGDFKTAWHIYRVAKANRLAPNSVTYGVLLKGAKLSGDYDAIRDAIKKVIREVLNDPPAMQDLRLLHDVMAAITFQRLQRHKPQFTFQQMLELYKRYCSLAPLRDLRICGPAESQLPPEATIKVQWPSSQILGQMVAFFAYMHRGEDVLIEVYNRYYAMVLEGHPLVARLAQDDFTANAFTKAFGYRSQTLKHCTTVLKHMLEDPSSSNSTTDPRSKHNGTSQSIQNSFTEAPCETGPEHTPDNEPASRHDGILQSANGSPTKSRCGTDDDLAPNNVPRPRRKPHPPTVRTWSILLWAYLKNGQKRAANKVTQIMQDRGVRPDKVAWNTLISGYAHMQDVDAAVDAVDRMQAAGYEPDARTIVDLGKLWERRRLVDVLQRVMPPAETKKETVRKVEKQAVELVTSELEADRRKQKEAEQFLSHIPSQLGNDYESLKAELCKTASIQKPHDKELEGHENEGSQPQTSDVTRDPGLHTMIQNVGSTAG